MPVLGQFVEGIQQTRPQPDKPVLLDTKLGGNDIGGFESNPPDVIGQTVWILRNDRYTFRSILFIDPCCMGCGHVLPLQEQHDVLDFFLLRPTPFYRFNPLLSNVRNRDQLIRVGLNDLQCVLAELIHYKLRKLRPDAFD